MTYTFTIPGDPVAQGRPRFTTMAGRRNLSGRGLIRAVDPWTSRQWKARARGYFIAEAVRLKLHAPIFPAGPLEVVVTAIFACQLGRRRKGTPAERRWKDTRPDIENIAKAALDAGNGVLWNDDGQVARLLIHKIEGAQNESAAVVVEVSPIQKSPALEVLEGGAGRPDDRRGE